MIKSGRLELRKQEVTITSVAVATEKILFGTCDCTVDIEVGMGDFSFVLGILHLWTRARAIACVLGHGLCHYGQ